MENGAKDFLMDYLNIHIIQEEIPEKKDVLNTLNNLLDLKELTQHYVFEIDSNPLFEYLDTKLKTGGKLIDDAFDNANRDKDAKIHRFLSIPEIAASDLERRFNTEFNQVVNSSFRNEDLEFFDGYTFKKNGNEIHIDGLKDKLKGNVRPYHKYCAVLYADGDNIGELLKSIAGDFGALKRFSKLLLDFGVQAEEAIHQYGGSGIYLGGEDILAFLPMACIDNQRNKTQTIFDLVFELDKIFDDTLGNYATEKGVGKPTLSYGIMISYFKHPLKESMDMAHELLKLVKEGKDKAGEILYPDKNSLALRFQKHSGQFMECVIEKSKNRTWQTVREIVKKYTENVNQISSGDKKEQEKKTDILSGVIQRLKDNTFFEVLVLAAKGGRLESFFENFFDEDIHKETAKSKFLNDVKELTEKIFNDYPVKEDCRKILFTVLRYIHFINSERD